MNQSCPKCKSTRQAAGSLYESGGRWGQSLFRPDGLRRMALLPTGGVPTMPFHACLDCGLVWSAVSPEEVSKYLAKYATDETRNALGVLDPDARFHSARRLPCKSRQPIRVDQVQLLA